jgi:SAM-dependent methyltransferase
MQEDDGHRARAGEPGDYAYGARDNLDAMTLAHNYNARIFRWISEGVTDGMRVLDFGSGGGEFANRFEFPITCVEPDESLHALVRHKAYRSLDDLDANDLDAQNTARPDHSDHSAWAARAAHSQRGFDLVYSINVLEHIRDDLSVLGSLFKLLKDGGRLKILAPAFGFLYGRMDAHVGHVRRYSRDGLGALLKEAGFEAIEICCFDSIGFFASLLYRLIGGRGDIDPADVSRYDRYVFPLSARLDEVFFLKKALGKNLMAEAVKNPPRRKPG